MTAQWMEHIPPIQMISSAQVLERPAHQHLGLIPVFSRMASRVTHLAWGKPRRGVPQSRQSMTFSAMLDEFGATNGI